MTKLTRFCDAFLEAAWLAALIVIPLFFNVYSRRAFEPDKIVILRCLAILVLAAWIVKLIDSGVRWKSLKTESSAVQSMIKIPLALPVAALAIVYILASALSVTPNTSFWGSYHRLQGLYTTLSYLVIFASMLGNLRQRSQVERLLTTAVICSLPICGYAVLQRFRLDPVLWGLGASTSTRVTANMGNPIFLSAYLIMVFPLTIYFLVQAANVIKMRGKPVGIWVARVVIFTLAALAQVATIYFTASRGPMLGWLGGAAFLVVFLALLWQKRGIILTAVGGAILLAAFVVVLNIPNGPLRGLLSYPNLARLAQIMDTNQPTGRIRMAYWQIAGKLIGSHEALTYPDGHQDALNPARFLLGYGPESMFYASNPFYSTEVTEVQRLFTKERTYAPPDRAHNETWDSLIFTGVLGMAAQLAVLASLFYFGFQWLGFISGQGDKKLFWLLSGGGAVLGVMGVVLWKGIGFLGVGLPFGILAGWMVYLLRIAFFRSRPVDFSGYTLERTLILMALLSAMAAHYIEINFAISIAVTQIYFWVDAALLVVVGYILPRLNVYLPEQAPAAVAGDIKEISAGKTRTRRGKIDEPGLKGRWRPGVLSGLLLAVILTTIDFTFINLGNYTSAWEILWGSFTSVPSRSYAFTPWTMVMLALVWGGLAFILATRDGAEETISGWSAPFWISLAVSGGLSFLYGLWLSADLSFLGALKLRSEEDVIQRIAGFEGLYVKYFVFILVLMFTYAVVRVVQENAEKISLVKSRAGAQKNDWQGWVAAAVALLLSGVLISTSCLNIIRADVAFNLADSFTQDGRLDLVALIQQRAIDLAPQEDYYYTYLGRTYVQIANTYEDAAQLDAFYRKAEGILKLGQQINPLNPDHTSQLALLYTRWAMNTMDETQKTARVQKAEDTYKLATMLSPYNAEIWYQWGYLYLSVKADPVEGMKKMTRSEELDPYYDLPYALTADYYTRLAQSLEDGEERLQNLELASASYQKAMELSPQKYKYILAAGEILVERQEYQQALEVYQRAYGKKVTPTDQLWQVEEHIAQVYLASQDKANALLHVQKALETAPQEQQAALQTLLQQITALP